MKRSTQNTHKSSKQDQPNWKDQILKQPGSSKPKPNLQKQILQQIHGQQNTKTKQNPVADIKHDTIRTIKTTLQKAIIAQNPDYIEIKNTWGKVEWRDRDWSWWVDKDKGNPEIQ